MDIAELKNRGAAEAHEDLRALLAILPPRFRHALEKAGNQEALLEVVMDLGRRPTARYVDGELVLSDESVTSVEIDQLVQSIGTFDDDNRAGIARTLHRIAGMRNRRGEVVGLTCRVGRAVYGTIDIVDDILAEGNSILLLGRPGVGKTTMLREMARVLSERRRVIIVDTSNEIGGDGDVPHRAVGRARRMQVPRPSHQHETMIEAVENHNPEVIIIDEIGRAQEAAAARTINERGVQLIGTAHGNTLENLLLNPTLSDLVGGIESVTLSDEEARRRGTQKTVLERRAPPTFNVLVELVDRNHVTVHRDVTEAVDNMLRHRPMQIERRQRNDEGDIVVFEEQVLKDTPGLTGRTDGRTRGESRETRRTRNLLRAEGGNNGNGSPADSGSALVNIVSDGGSRPQMRVFPYGVARNRLLQAARQLGVDVEVVDDLSEAEVLVTLKSYYRRRRRVIADAEKRRKPIYVLRANTVNQMQNFLAEAMDLEVVQEDPFDVAIAEAENAIRAVQSGQRSVALTAANSNVRRQQHQLARQANLVSHSYGREPNRFVRIFASDRMRSR